MPDALPAAESPFATCPQCGAARHPAGRYCWLCGGVLTGAVAAAPPEATVIQIQEASDDSRLSAGQQRLLVWLAVVVVAVIGFGVAASQDWLIATLYVVAVVPTLLVVLLGTTSARAQGQPWTPAKTAAVAATTATGTVLTTVVVAIVAAAVAVLVVFAMVIAMVQQCFQALGGGS